MDIERLPVGVRGEGKIARSRHYFNGLLALAETLPRPRLHYMGLDIAKPMLAKARTLVQACIDKSLLGSSTSMQFLPSWAALHRSASMVTVPVNVLFNATYLFASSSLDVEDVAKSVVDYKSQSGVQRVLFCYSNTLREIAGRKYSDFKKLIRNEIVETTEPTTRSVSYDNKTASFVSELIRFK